MSANEAILVIGAVTTSILSILSALFAGYAAIRSSQNGQGINQVHAIVNSQKSAMQEEIDGLRKLMMTSMEQRKPVPAAGAIAVDEKKADTIAKAQEGMVTTATSVTKPPEPEHKPEAKSEPEKKTN